MTITIVTPWLDHLELAEDYFEAVLPELRTGDALTIIDNGSTEPLQFATHAPGENLGFCAASNLGLYESRTDAVLFLNNDVALGRKGWLQKIRIAVAPGVLVGPLRTDGHADVDGIPMPYLDGWCLCGMRSDLLSIGGFPTDLEEPAYYSDNLLCLEARAMGISLQEVRVGLEHKESQTSQPWRDPHVGQVTLANREKYLARARAILAVA